MTRVLLAVFSVAVFSALVAVSYWATSHVSIAPAIQDLMDDPTRAYNPWFWATLVDAYFGFLWFWLFVAWRERNVVRSALWLVPILLAGNMAMAAYMLWALWQTRGEARVGAIFRPRGSF